MTVFLINPNSTDAMTQSALEAAQAAAPELHFVGWTSSSGPASIEGAEDGARAVPPLLDLVRAASDMGAEVIIIACFDDTGLGQAQRIASCPVIGIGQASFVIAALMSGPTAIITTVQAAVPVITANLRAQGHAANIAHVLAADVAVLTLENDPDKALERFEAAALRLPDDTENLILGCSGAVSIVQRMQSGSSRNIIDGVSAAARLSKALVT